MDQNWISRVYTIIRQVRVSVAKFWKKYDLLFGQQNDWEFSLEFKCHLFVAYLTTFQIDMCHNRSFFLPLSLCYK